jgi:hypothetical protein
MRNKLSSTSFFYKLIFFLLSFSILTILSIQSPIGITFFPLVLIFFTPLLFILWLVKLESIKNIPVRRYNVYLIIAIVLSFFASIGIIKYQKSATMDNAEPLIHALEKYNYDRNLYPQNLNELKTEYLTNIPRTKMGWLNVDFEYTPYNNMKEFRLSFKYLATLRCIYNSEMKNWVNE